jgi:hypothetical protein
MATEENIRKLLRMRRPEHALGDEVPVNIFEDVEREDEFLDSYGTGITKGKNEGSRPRPGSGRVKTALKTSHTQPLRYAPLKKKLEKRQTPNDT